MKRKKISFVCYGGGHVNMLVPIIQVLADRYEISCLALTTAKTVLDAEGIPSIGFKDLLLESDQRAIETGKQLAEGLPEGPVSLDESIAYLGLSYVDLENTIGEKEAEFVYAKKGRAVFLPTPTLKRFLIQEKPDLLVTTISPRAEEASIYAARELGIPSICLVDLFGRPSIRRASQKHYADKVCVISDDVKKLMVQYGRNADDILVTGNPVFDALFDPDIKTKAANLRQKKNWCDKKVILWASQIEPKVSPTSGKQGDPQLPDKIEKMLINLAENRSDWHLVIRPHPNESRGLVESAESVEFCDQSDPLNVLLKAVDVVVIMTSTVGYEAGLIDTPVISVDLSVFSEDTPYSELNLSKGVKAISDLERVLEDVLDHKSSNDEKNSSAKKSGATGRIVAVIENMLEKVVRAG